MIACLPFPEEGLRCTGSINIQNVYKSQISNRRLLVIHSTVQLY